MAKRSDIKKQIVNSIITTNKLPRLNIQKSLLFYYVRRLEENNVIKKIRKDFWIYNEIMDKNEVLIKSMEKIKTLLFNDKISNLNCFNIYSCLLVEQLITLKQDNLEPEIRDSLNFYINTLKLMCKFNILINQHIDDKGINRECPQFTLFPEYASNNLRKRFNLLHNNDFKCVYCGRSPPEVKLELEHIYPKSKGGLNEIDNLSIACADCNRGKSDLIIKKFNKGVAK